VALPRRHAVQLIHLLHEHLLLRHHLGAHGRKPAVPEPQPHLRAPLPPERARAGPQSAALAEKGAQQPVIRQNERIERLILDNLDIAQCPPLTQSGHAHAPHTPCTCAASTPTATHLLRGRQRPSAAGMRARVNHRERALRRARRAAGEPKAAERRAGGRGVFRLPRVAGRARAE